MQAPSAPTADPQDVLHFWFGDAPAAPREAWFRKDEAFDAQIHDRFGALVEQAIAGALDAWRREPESALARLIVLDQFTRNAWRDTPRAFAGDALALAGARALVDGGGHQALAPLQRVFVYLPFEHAEDLGAQAQAVRLFEALARQAPPLADYLPWAHKHHAVVERFGRFPHRNLVLGRQSTAQELAFLEEPGSRF